MCGLPAACYEPQTKGAARPAEPHNLARAGKEPVVLMVDLLIQRARLRERRRLEPGRRLDLAGIVLGGGRGGLRNRALGDRRTWCACTGATDGNGGGVSSDDGYGSVWSAHGSHSSRRVGRDIGGACWLRGLLDFDLIRRAYTASAVVVVAGLVGQEPQQMREEFDRAAETLPGAAWIVSYVLKVKSRRIRRGLNRWCSMLLSRRYVPFGVAVEIGILPVVAAARVVLGLAIGLGLDVLVQAVVLGKVPQNALLPFVFVLLAPNLAQQHAAQLLAPVDMLRVVLLDQAVVVALALLVGRAVELRFGRAIPNRLALVGDDGFAVGALGEYGPEQSKRLAHDIDGCASARPPWCSCGVWRGVWKSGRAQAYEVISSAQH